jgi:hypothetical protein
MQYIYYKRMTLSLLRRMPESNRSLSLSLDWDGLWNCYTVMIIWLSFTQNNCILEVWSSPSESFLRLHFSQALQHDEHAMLLSVAFQVVAAMSMKMAAF